LLIISSWEASVELPSGLETILLFNLLVNVWIVSLFVRFVC